MVASRVLIAYSVLPGVGSEPGVGWEMLFGSISECLRSNESLLAFVRASHLDACSERLEKLGLESAVQLIPVQDQLVSLPLPTFFRRRLSYLRWREKAMKAITRFLDGVQPLSVHQVTWATAFLPHACPPHLLPAFIWGPVTVPSIPSSPFAPFFRFVRNSLVRRNIGNVGLVIAGNNDSFAVFEKLTKARQELRLEPNVFAEPGALHVSTEPGLVSVIGVLEERKRVDLAIRAFGSKTLANFRLQVIGDGPQRKRLERLAKRLGVASRVTFMGLLSRSATQQMLARSAVLVHPSKREGSPWVVGEAAALGVPSVVFNDTGAATVLKLSGGGGMTVARRRRPERNLALAIFSTAIAPRPPVSDRWSRKRLQAMIPDWWATVYPRKRSSPLA